jgi:hypothetical protein
MSECSEWYISNTADKYIPRGEHNHHFTKDGLRILLEAVVEFAFNDGFRIGEQAVLRRQREANQPEESK